ncbi:MAG: preprotein translocase subunit SecG [Methylococcaceae bacterium]|nr:preprotein translocase subunit SecG [Methylococcaceae bacterium]
MYQFIIIIHVLLGLGIIGLVLMQQGRGADAGAAFGSGSSGSVFGAQGSASFLSRTTAIFAALFFSTSLGLAFLNGQSTAVVDLMQAPKVEKNSVDIPDVAPAATKVTDAVPSIPVTATVESVKPMATINPAQPDLVAPSAEKQK